MSRTAEDMLLVEYATVPSLSGWPTMAAKFGQNPPFFETAFTPGRAYWT